MKMRAMEGLNDREQWELWQAGEYILCLQALKFKFLRNPVLGKLNIRLGPQATSLKQLVPNAQVLRSPAESGQPSGGVKDRCPGSL